MGKTFEFKLMDMVLFKTQKKGVEPFVVLGRAILEEPKGVEFIYFLKNSIATHSMVTEVAIVAAFQK